MNLLTTILASKGDDDWDVFLIIIVFWMFFLIGSNRR